MSISKVIFFSNNLDLFLSYLPDDRIYVWDHEDDRWELKGLFPVACERNDDVEFKLQDGSFSISLLAVSFLILFYFCFLN